MVLINHFRRLFDFNRPLKDSEDPDSNNLLVIKGNQLHEIILFSVLVFGAVLSLLNYLFNNHTDALISLTLLPGTLVSFLLLYFRKRMMSKIWNLALIAAVISLVCLNSTPQTGVLAFFFPVLMVAQLVFQGSEQTVGRVLSFLLMILMIFLIQTDLRLPGSTVYTAEELVREKTLNYTAVSIATFLGMLSIIKFSQTIQDHLLRRTMEINTKNEELTKANAELDNFVYRVSHDLRSPLLSVKGLISLVSQLPLEPEKARQYLTMADKSINRLDETIREILEYSRNSRLNLRMEPFNIKRTVEAIFEDLRYLAPEALRFTVTLQGPEDVTTDGYRINTVLRNLITNAVKYHSKESDTPMVAVNIMNMPDSLRITVSDNGQGIQPVHLPKVFEMFYRATNSTSGTGLGLYICKEIVGRLGGKILLESTPGIGTVVVFEIPQSKPGN